jgi:hypothetical protein
MNESFYECQRDWPEDCFVQGGDNGIVFTQKDAFEDILSTPDPLDMLNTIVTGEGQAHYRTAFFEAFPNNPDTFIRGEGPTIQAAEESAWQQFQKFLACPGPNGHEFEARGYENGAGFCKHCGMFGSHVIAPIHNCCNCGQPTWYHKDIQGDWWCQTREPTMPEERKSELDKKIEASIDRSHLALQRMIERFAEKGSPEQASVASVEEKGDTHGC